MSCHNKLQQLCRKYLKKLYRKARDIGLDKKGGNSQLTLSVIPEVQRTKDF